MKPEDLLNIRKIKFFTFTVFNMSHEELDKHEQAIITSCFVATYQHFLRILSSHSLRKRATSSSGSDEMKVSFKGTTSGSSKKFKGSVKSYKSEVCWSITSHIGVFYMVLRIYISHIHIHKLSVKYTMMIIITIDLKLIWKYWTKQNFICDFIKPLFLFSIFVV